MTDDYRGMTFCQQHCMRDVFWIAKYASAFSSTDLDHAVQVLTQYNPFPFKMQLTDEKDPHGRLDAVIGGPGSLVQGSPLPLESELYPHQFKIEEGKTSDVAIILDQRVLGGTSISDSNACRMAMMFQQGTWKPTGPWASYMETVLFPYLIARESRKRVVEKVTTATAIHVCLHTILTFKYGTEYSMHAQSVSAQHWLPFFGTMMDTRFPLLLQFNADGSTFHMLVNLDHVARSVVPILDLQDAFEW